MADCISAEITNLLTAGGDLFRKEHSVETPTGLVDILPTMLAALDVEAPASTTGRVSLRRPSGVAPRHPSGKRW